MLEKTTEFKINTILGEDSVYLAELETYLLKVFEIQIILDNLKASSSEIKQVNDAVLGIDLKPFLTHKDIKSFITAEQAKVLFTKELKPFATLPNEFNKKIQILETSISNLPNYAKDIADLNRQIENIQQDCSSLVRNIRDLGFNNKKIDVQAIEESILKKLDEKIKNEPEGEKQRYYRIFKVFTKNYDGLVPKPSDTDISGDKVLRADGSWVTQSGGGGGVNSVVAGQNITVDNTDPANPIVASSGQADPNNTILGTGITGDEFRYNERVIVVSSTTVFLDDTMNYYTFTTDGSTNFDFDYTNITLNDFTFKVFVDQRNPAQITIPVNSFSIWLGNYEYFAGIRTAQKGASATVRLKNNRINITNLCGNWSGN